MTRQNYEQLEAIGSAASSIAHDLNNQLMLAMNYIEFAEIHQANSALKRCSSLTSDLLSICRNRSFELRPVDPATFIRAFARSLRLPPTCRVRVEGHRVLMPVLVDQESLERVLGHIVLNAREAMQDEGVITIRAADSRIEICDNGPGIPESDLARVFDPNFTTKSQRGSGLGLAVVRDVMHRHGGSAQARRLPSGGTCIELRFRSVLPV